VTLSQQQRRVWSQRLSKLSRAAQRAQDDLLAGIYEARTDGLPQADVASAVDALSPSGVKAKEAKGKEIFERRRRGPKAS
jgi:hypothetical protein